MNEFIRWYNQNRAKLWFMIFFAIIICFIVFRTINIVLNNTTNKTESSNIVSNIDNSNLNSITIASNKSALSGQMKKLNNNEMEIIDNFISFCNAGNVQEAYNLISNECKEEMYQDINRFIEAYYKPVFSFFLKNASVENWNNDTYMVSLNLDALATGSFSEENVIKDYKENHNSRNASIGTTNGFSGAQLAVVMSKYNTCSSNTTNGYNAYSQMKTNFFDKTESAAFSFKVYGQDVYTIQDYVDAMAARSGN